MFSRKYYPIDKRNFNIHSNSFPFVFSPFSRQIHIRTQKPGECIKNGPLCERHAHTRLGADEEDSVEECSQCARGAISTTSLPTEEELREAGKYATARIVRILTDDDAIENLEEGLDMYEKASARVPSPQVPGICHELYLNDIKNSQLSKRSVLGRLPQTSPKPYHWKADHTSTVVPRTRVITVGYQIRYPYARRTSDHLEDMTISGLSLSGNAKRKLKFGQPQDSKQNDFCRDRAAESSISFFPVPETARHKVCEGQAAPLLYHSKSEMFKTPWWVAREHKSSREKISASTPSPEIVPRGVQYWDPYGSVYTLTGLSLASDVVKTPGSRGRS